MSQFEREDEEVFALVRRNPNRQVDLDRSAVVFSGERNDLEIIHDTNHKEAINYVRF